MTDLRVREARQRLEQTRRVQAMIDTIRGLLAGSITRAQAKAWTRELWPEGSGQGDPFRAAELESVFDSLWNIDERDDDGDVIRDSDLRAYLDWLTRGESFLGDKDPLVVLAIDRDTFAAQVGCTPVRFCVEGLGWFWNIRFCALATGRPFSACAGETQLGVVEICKQQRDPWRDALIDLFETLAIDEHDVAQLHPDVDLEQLPAWSLWREDDNANRFEIDRFHSFAKADALERMFTARGHRQFYWVEPAS